jgi:hypothetical protein
MSYTLCKGLGVGLLHSQMLSIGVDCSLGKSTLPREQHQNCPCCPMAMRSSDLVYEEPISGVACLSPFPRGGPVSTTDYLDSLAQSDAAVPAALEVSSSEDATCKLVKQHQRCTAVRICNNKVSALDRQPNLDICYGI